MGALLLRALPAGASCLILFSGLSFPLLSSVPQAPESLLHCQLLLWPGSGAPMSKVVLHKCSITIANFLFEDYKTLGAESHLGLFLETCSVLIACIID